MTAVVPLCVILETSNRNCKQAIMYVYLLFSLIIPYKMKNWCRIYFGSLVNYVNPPN